MIIDYDDDELFPPPGWRYKSHVAAV